MIAYFDTSSLVPLLVDEPGSETAGRLWIEADRLVSARLLYPEARSALASAERTRRITAADLRTAVLDLDKLLLQVEAVEVTHSLAHRAGELAQTHALRGYDAVHLAAAESIADADLVLVAGDADLLEAATTIGIATATT
ncbi:MAG: type II toxin-antitoxin system VapC family toxin [Actinobacteria bacterium]|nr:type II toxin-antitoxin system VapC family toxin [Actinomycetota bacterium]